MINSRRILTSTAITALILGLNGCGGSETPPPSPPPPPPPVNAAPTFSSSAAADLPESDSQDVVYKAEASDGDGDSLTFSISGGADMDLFTIDGSNGEVRLLASIDDLNFESPADADSDNVYEFTIEVSDGEASDSLAVSLTVTDVIESKIMRFAGGANGSADILEAGDFTGTGELTALLFDNTFVPLSFFRDPGQATDLSPDTFPGDQTLLRIVDNASQPFVVDYEALVPRRPDRTERGTFNFGGTNVAQTFLSSTTRSDFIFGPINIEGTEIDVNGTTVLRQGYKTVFALDTDTFEGLNGQLNIENLSQDVGVAMVDPETKFFESDDLYINYYVGPMLHDFNDDGIDEIVVTDRQSMGPDDNPVLLIDGSVALNSVSQVYTPTTDFGTTDVVDSVEPFIIWRRGYDDRRGADLDGDGKNDFITSSGIIFANNMASPLRGFSFNYNAGSRYAFDSYAGSDLDGDMVPEFLSISFCQCSRNQARGSFVSSARIAEFRDFDFDGLNIDQLDSDERLNITYTVDVTGEEAEAGFVLFVGFQDLGDLTGDNVSEFAMGVLEYRNILPLPADPDAAIDFKVVGTVFVLDGQRLDDLFETTSNVEISSSSFPNLVTLNTIDSTGQRDPNDGSNVGNSALVLKTLTDVDEDGSKELIVTNHLALDIDTIGELFLSRSTPNGFSGETNRNGESYFIPGQVIGELMRSGGGTIDVKSEL